MTIELVIIIKQIIGHKEHLEYTNFSERFLVAELWHGKDFVGYRFNKTRWKKLA